MITSLLIANRGEIARRIIRTAHEMGISTVAGYADGDVDAPHVREADVAVALGGVTAGETYLDGGKVIAAALRVGADAVHPGYGFLSENADFAQAVIDAGLIWVGPRPDSIRRIGDKLSAKRMMAAAGVPTLEVVEGAGAVWPLLVKASAGGGGRGMRVVEGPGDLPGAIESARREAMAAFGDGTVFLERYLTGARHVEIQILGDRHGGVVHLFERECSIQRRHQKIIEEAPSPGVSEGLRARMGEAALTVARAIGYESAGTVEFLVKGDEFFFLEVNTRLQVEHPVTEAITGLDLVREQLRIASGEALGYGQGDLRIEGHAIEARLCAEDPARDFLPSPGVVTVWEPAGGVRVDSGVEAGSAVDGNFDPMFAKVIAHGKTRQEAAAVLARALERSRIQGLTHNRDVLVAILRSEAFRAGDTTTDFLERVRPAAVRAVGAGEVAAACVAAALWGRAMRLGAATVLRTIPGGFRNSVMPAERVGYRVGDMEHEVTYRARRDGGLAVAVDGVAMAARVMTAEAGGIVFSLDGQRHGFKVTDVGGVLHLHGVRGDIDLVERPRFPPPAGLAQGGGLRAPMPGRVLALHVVEGQAVAQGDVLLVLEAMKMEHRIVAPADGVVTALRVGLGEQVANGAPLVTIEPVEN